VALLVGRSGTGYDAWGNPSLANTALEPTLGFGGQLQFGVTVDLRARNYNATLGAFDTTDPLDGVNGTTTVSTPYPYGDNSPIEYGDLSGEAAIDRNAFYFGDSPGGGLAAYEAIRSDSNTIYNLALDFTWSQMKMNAVSDVTKDIHHLLHPNLFEQVLGSPSVDQITGLAAWAQMVRTGGPWDFKPELQSWFFPGVKAYAGMVMVIPGTNVQINYDLWSNIHYGYVGIYAGLSEGDLQEAAAKIGLYKFLPGAGVNDPGDVTSVQIGIQLSRINPRDLQPQDITNAIIAAVPQYLAEHAQQVVLI
jgi:RHS repeat-associated protein